VDLYALPPEEFTAARDALAVQDKSAKKLRKPTVAAWVVNTLVRREPELLDQLLSLGAELAAAQSGRDAAALRALGEQRRQLVAAVTEQAVRHVGREVSAGIYEEVQATLEAALADPPSAEAVRSGNLVRSLSFAGFGGVDLEGAVATPVVAPPPSVAALPAGKVRKLEAAALQTQGSLDDAVRLAERVARELAAAGHSMGQAQEAFEAADARLSELRASLVASEQAQASARSLRSKARKEHEELARKADRAAQGVAEAQESFDAARKALDALRRA
jgi:hypothetical protein